MTSYDDLDAQLAALQATLKVEVQKSQEDFDWPETPDLDSLTISKIEESSPTIQELEEVSSSSSSKSSSVTSPNIEKTITSPEILEKSLPDLKKPCEPINHKAESEVDKITEALMTNLENGTTPKGENTVPERGPNEICAKCKQPIASFDAACSAMGKYFHITCLTCLKCNKALHGTEFIVMGDDNPYCQDCYEETLEVCCECNQPIRQRILRAAGKIYHPECFKCSNCKKSLDGIPFTQDDNQKPFCVDCYQDLYSPKCEKCKKPIAPEPGQQEAMRIIALEKSFHKACFTCKSCELSLSDKNSGGCYPVDSDLFCKRCSIDAINKRSG